MCLRARLSAILYRSYSLRSARCLSCLCLQSLTRSSRRLCLLIHLRIADQAMSHSLPCQLPRKGTTAAMLRGACMDAIPVQPRRHVIAHRSLQHRACRCAHSISTYLHLVATFARSAPCKHFLLILPVSCAARLARKQDYMYHWHVPSSTWEYTASRLA